MDLIVEAKIFHPQDFFVKCLLNCCHFFPAKALLISLKYRTPEKSFQGKSATKSRKRFFHHKVHPWKGVGIWGVWRITLFLESFHPGMASYKTKFTWGPSWLAGTHFVKTRVDYAGRRRPISQPSWRQTHVNFRQSTFRIRSRDLGWPAERADQQRVGRHHRGNYPRETLVFAAATAQFGSEFGPFGNALWLATCVTWQQQQIALKSRGHNSEQFMT